MDPKATVAQAGHELFVQLDMTAVDRWFTPGYRQHSAVAADGLMGLRALISTVASTDFRYEGSRILADGDLVAMHGIYHGVRDRPQVGFDLFRVEDSKLAEHWDGLTSLAESTASGRSQVDGPTDIGDPAHSDRTRERVVAFTEQVFVQGRYTAAADHISAEAFHQHSPGIPDGLDSFRTALKDWADDGRRRVYDKIHHVLAEGDFALTHCEGRSGTEQTAFWDLYRVEDGKIVEHWDAQVRVPAALPHHNGMF